MTPREAAALAPIRAQYADGTVEVIDSTAENWTEWCQWCWDALGDDFDEGVVHQRGKPAVVFDGSTEVTIPTWLCEMYRLQPSVDDYIWSDDYMLYDPRPPLT